MKIVCIGHAAYDITIPLDQFVLENTKNRVKERIENGGGPAATAAYLLGKWGMDVTFLGVVGNDEYGKTIKKELESVNVNTKYLQLSDMYKTTSSFIIANKSNGSRTILTYREKEMKMNGVALDFEPDIILMDGQEIEMSKILLLRYPNAISIIDAGRKTDDIVALAKLNKYVVCSKEFAEEVTNIKLDYNDKQTIIDLYTKMEQEFSNSEIIITLESKGALYKDNKTIKIMPSIEVTPLDSTGAGDIFHGAFTYGLVKRKPLEQIIRISNITGALSVTKLGSRNSIFTLEEMINISDEFK